MRHVLEVVGGILVLALAGIGCVLILAALLFQHLFPPDQFDKGAK